MPKIIYEWLFLCLLTEKTPPNLFVRMPIELKLEFEGLVDFFDSLFDPLFEYVVGGWLEPPCKRKGWNVRQSPGENAI